MALRGSAFPSLISAFSPDSTVSPTLSPLGASMYRHSPSGYFTRAMRAVRLGSYSIDVISPGMPNLSRLKSIIRKRRLCPPPRWRTVIRPLEFRPPRFFNGANRDFFGLRSVMSSVVCCTRPRWPGVSGLLVFSGIKRPRKL